MNYVEGKGAEIDALCSLFERFAVKNAFHPDTPALYKDTGMQVLVQRPEPDHDTKMVDFVFGTDDNLMMKVSVDMQTLTKGAITRMVDKLILDLFDARQQKTPLVIPPFAKKVIH